MKRITFGDILIIQDGASLSVDFASNDSNIKTFASITLPDNCVYTIGSGDGSSWNAANHTIVTGDFVVGNNGEGNVYGKFIEIQGDFDAGESTRC